MGRGHNALREGVTVVLVVMVIMVGNGKTWAVAAMELVVRFPGDIKIVVD